MTFYMFFMNFQAYILTITYNTACTARITIRSLEGEGNVTNTPGTNAMNKAALTKSFAHIYSYIKVFFTQLRSTLATLLLLLAVLLV